MIFTNEVNQYIANFPLEVQNKLIAIRQIIQDEAPQVTERICMRIPTYDLNGKWFVHFAAFKKHIGFYPQPDVIESFKEDLRNYKTSKGSIQFPLSTPLPVDLIRNIIIFKKTLEK